MKPLQRTLITIAAATSIMGSAACTGQLADSFRLKQQEENFATNVEINTKVDLLWVVDNSASMDASQEKLRVGFAAFADKYMQPTWDIRVAVITTDAFMAHPSFSDYINRTIPGTTGQTSNYINGRLTTWQNPSWNPNLYNKATQTFDNGVKFGELVPLWGPNYAQLLPGYHDGPITGFCFEWMPYFLDGVTQCAIRDDQTGNTGPDACLNPGAGEDSISQCVNTIQNDTVRSGKAIIETMPPSGVAGDATWRAQLIRDFTTNITTGSIGHGSERGISSVLQLLNDNESSETAFFRPGSMRSIIFVSDEEDQSIAIPSTPPANFSPWSGFHCDQNSLLDLNSASPGRITGVNGYCCDTAGNNCFLGYEGLTCASKTIDGYTYIPSVCADPAQLIDLGDVKTSLDTFFMTLDGSTENPNYFVVSIVPLTGQAIQDLQAERDALDASLNAVRTQAVDRGDRYLQLGTLVGNGSLGMNIAASDYSPILDAIGRAIIEKAGTFELNRTPTNEEEMIVWIVHEDGSKTEIPSDKYVIDGNNLVVTDVNLILSFKSTDQIRINYQPKTLY